jgi:hypothetical protein
MCQSKFDARLKGKSSQTWRGTGSIPIVATRWKKKSFAIYVFDGRLATLRRCMHHPYEFIALRAMYYGGRREV